ncbi:hypothetical protein [Tsukamurella pseudospumae]|uniref:Phospholipase A2 n=1 Tax=Tsukamurella pseudospumae TaxID=239498 RepID=A0A137ZLT8_9ACTN|nr:hypothetical protein [Tsukamurella pseudospumae]KXO99127.1 hypothetical protein AXK61_17785 [Tsukamurella pseudospumae]
MTRRMLAAAAVLAVPLSFGISLPAAAENVVPAEDASSAAAVRAVSAPTVAVVDQIRSIPAGFGYVAAAGPGYAVDPHGECSSVVPLPADFDAPCKAHDLGYDLLRHADAAGHPLGGWARRLIDDTLAERLSAACGARPVQQRRQCAEVAGIAVLAVRANTWRQHDGPPRAESVAELATSWLTVGGRL